MDGVDATVATAAVATVVTAVSGFKTVVGKAVSVADTFVTASFGMTKAASNGAAGLEAMGSAVGSVARQIPVIGTAFAETLSIAIDVLEKDIQTQRTLSDVGATFGGNLKSMRESVDKTYLSMDQFGKVVGANAEMLASFEGGVQGGTEIFTKVLTSLQKTGSETSNTMANLGIGFEDAAQMTAQFMRGLGNMNKTGQMSADQLAKASADYAVELTGLSNLTGQSRKALAEKINEEMAEAQFQNYLNSIEDPVERAKIQAAVAQELIVGGKAGADAMKATIAGFPPMTEASKILTATQQATVARQQELLSKIKDSTVDFANFQSQSRKGLADSVEGMKENQKTFSTVFLGMALAGGNPYTKANEGQTKFLNAVQGKTSKDILEVFDKLAASVPKPTEVTAGVDYQKEIIDMGNARLSEMRGLLDGALKKGLEFSRTMQDASSAMIDGVKTALGEFNVGEVVSDLNNGLQEQIKKLKNFNTAKALDEMKKAAADANYKPKPGESKTPAVIGAVAGGIKDSLPVLGDQLSSFVDSADKLIKGDLKGAIESFSTIVPNFFRMVEIWSDRIRQITNILGIDKNTNKNDSRQPIPVENLPPEYTNQTPTISTPPSPKPKAAGGETNPGSYLVGEQGPEVLNLGTRGDVINNDNLTAMISALSNQNDMGESIDQLNNTNSQMLAAIRDLIDVSKRTLTATKGLNGNLFAA
jgi:DNA-binding transcriptional regulator YiaG